MPVTAVVARPFRRPAPSSGAAPAPMAPWRRAEPVRGSLVGVTDGRSWGWWGPVPGRVARVAVELHEAAASTEPSSPAEWGHRWRRTARHAHTGWLGWAVGAVELACWDLAGQRAGLPVWALCGAPAGPPAPSYATCFGPDLTEPGALAAAASVAGIWDVQKWSGRQAPAAGSVDAIAAAAGGDGHLALDFGGELDPGAVHDLLARLGHRLAWVEEPYAPGDLHRARPGEFAVAHAAGEHCYGPFETPVLVAAGVHVWQPDAVFCGGFAPFCEILRLAVAAAARSAPHGGGFLPAVHASVAGTPTWLIEYHLLLEPRRQAHLAEPLVPRWDDGDCSIPVPDRPGWAGPLHRDLAEAA